MRTWIVVSASGLLLICLAGCAHHVAEGPPSPAQAAAENATTACLRKAAAQYDNQKIKMKALAKLIMPNCQPQFDAEQSALNSTDDAETRRGLRDLFREATLAILAERNARGQGYAN
jgi:hypothetical protein